MGLSPLNYVHLENGKFSGTTRHDLETAFTQFQQNPPPGGWVLHFHGGFVGSGQAKETAEQLLPQYQASEAYPLFFVWETGAWETVVNNLRDITNEPFFKNLLDKLAAFIQSKLGLSSSGSDSRSGFQPGASETLESLLALELNDPEGPAWDEIAQPAPNTTDISEEELQSQWAGDEELKSAYENLAARVAYARASPQNESLAAPDDDHGILPSANAQKDLFSSNIEESAAATSVSLIWLTKVAVVAARIGKRVVTRLIQSRDHGWYTTLVEEALREMYGDKIGAALFWNQIKRDAADAFKPDAEQHGGTAFLELLKSQISSSNGQAPRVTLIAHDAGACFASQFLVAAHNILPVDFQFDIVLLAPAIDCGLASQARETNRVRNIRLFGLSDALEAKDAMLGPVSGWLRGLYPRSMLYFISGLMESEVDAPLLGMQRYYDSSRYPASSFPELQKIRDYLQQGSDRLVWSIDDDGPGRKCSATHHDQFDSDSDTLASVQHILKHGFASSVELDWNAMESALSYFNIHELVELAKELPGVQPEQVEQISQAIEGNPLVESIVEGALEGQIKNALLNVAEEMPDGYRQLLLCAHRLKPSAQLLRVLRDQPRKMDMNLQKALQGVAVALEQKTRFTPTLESVTDEPSEPKLPILIGLADASQNVDDVPGLEIVSKIGRIVAAIAPQSALDRLSRDDRVISVELSRNNGHFECVQSIPFIGAVDGTTQQRLAEQGDQCLIAIVDADIDVLHAAFREPDKVDANGQVILGKTRIHAIWDQTDPTGPAPQGLESLGGTLHSSNEIDGYIQSGLVGKQLRRVKGGHGTHVASIAAGSPITQTNFPGGVAPQAKLLLIVTNSGQFEEDSPSSLGYSLYHSAALTYIEQVASALNLPVVVNLSQGMNAGAHDGTSLVEVMFDDFCQKGRRQGRVIVKSAGNDRASAGHAFITLSSNQIEFLEWESPVIPRFNDLIDIWFSSKYELSFRLVTPGGEAGERINRKDGKKTGSFASGNTYELRYEASTIDNGASRLQVEIGRGTTSMIEVGVKDKPWVLEISSGALTGTAEIDAWVDRTAMLLPKFVSHVSEERTLSVPGTADSVIAVGAVGSQLPLRVGRFSAYGKTRDGREKPEVSAPGVDILAAQGNTPDSLHKLSGTSMAAPHVTGAIALVLSACKKNPALKIPTAKQISVAFSRIHPTWDRGIGWGCLNVQRLMNEFVP